jgi:hypothetical protein
VLIALSLPGVDAMAIIDDEVAKWRERLSDARASAVAQQGLVALASAAEASRARAAVEWLSDAAAVDVSALSFAPSTTRPRRGRRPSAAPAA